MPALQVQDVSLYWDGKPVCENISFEVGQGETVCLLGRSGTGKTTIFHAIAGLTVPESGRILLAGEDMTGRPGHISYMLQNDLLLKEHTIIDNVGMPLVVKGASRREAREKAHSLLPDFGLEGTDKLYPFQLSGGMRQRAALLRTYLAGNDVVLMDEPFSALDAFTRIEMRRWFTGMLESLGISAVLVTHDIDEAVAMADRILVLAGNPAQDEPSTIVGQVDIDIPKAARDAFSTSPEATSAKDKVLELLI